MGFVLAATALEGVVQLITVILVFGFVLVITYMTTRWVGTYQKSMNINKNIEVIETFKVTANKYIQIIKAGEKYLVIAVCKDTITMLTEVSSEELEFKESTGAVNEPFKEILDKAKNLMQKK